MARPAPWIVTLGGIHQGRSDRRSAAMNLVDRPYRYGFALIRNERTGEAWKRVKGSWFKIRESRHRRAHAA